MPLNQKQFYSIDEKKKNEKKTHKAIYILMLTY